MDNNLNNEAPKDNKKTIIIIVVIVLALIVGIILVTKVLNSNNKSNASKKSNSAISEKSSTAKESTLENYVGLNEWTKASKYVSLYLSQKYKDIEYETVPVRITKVIRGEAATKILKDYVDKKANIKVEELDDDIEWAVFEYEVDLNGLTFDENTIGTDAKISNDVVGLDGNAVVYKNTKYIMITYNINESDDFATKKGVYTKRFVAPLPIGCKDYIVTIGDGYKQTIAYIKPE